ncbi:MAG: thioether cross-link-forming SCIFF peptide maturase [Eubacteriales bacterium]|nr:thioether cross-link-forming SCIFF peptide maturase [Eubacteriales bacterium]
MVHLFNFQQDQLAFDSESGALHVVDLTSAAVIQAFIDNVGQKPSDHVLAELKNQFGEDVTDCCDDIETLIARGELFAPPQHITPEQLYPDQPRIKSMCLHISHDCNLRCKYCFAGTGDFGTGRRIHLDLATGKKAIDFLIEASGPRRNLDIDFFGGEPLLNWPVVTSLVEYCEQKGRETGKVLRLTMTTNGVLLDEVKSTYINEHFKNVVLSLDGRPDVHDRMRPDAGGKGSYTRVADHFKEFIKLRGTGEYYLRGTFTGYNLDFTKDVLHMATVGQQLSMEPVVAPPGSGYEISPNDLPVIEAEYEKLALEMRAAKARGESFNFFHFMLDLNHGPCAFKRIKGCGVGIEYCAVTPDGDIYPCHQFVGEEAYIMGNVHDQPITLNQTVQSPFYSLLVPDKTECQTCWAKYFCSGGCAANSLHVNGRVDGVDPISCQLQKKRLECALWLKT